jgi:hypothetical protein
MDKMLERAIRFAYRRAAALGADAIEAFETALIVLFDARPDLGEGEARSTLALILRGCEGELAPAGMAPRRQL